MKPQPSFELYNFDNKTTQTIPLYTARVSAGFPSPADDFIDKKLDLNEHLIEHPSATFFVRVEGESMLNAGIHPGDLLIVDRSKEAADKKIIIAALNGELTVKRVRKMDGQLFLMPDNPKFPPIQITEDVDFEIWGVVTYVIHQT